VKTKTKAYRKITAENITADDGSTVDLIIDPSKRKEASWDGTYTPAIDIGYSRPEFSRLPIGHFGENIVLTDGPVEVIDVWHVVDLDSGSPRAQLANPLLRDNHPTRYAVISGVWANLA
jgi:hypothetical protein